MARPTKFKEEFIAIALKLTKLGATDIEIADFLEIDVRTLYRWRHENEAFCQALRVGKEESDERVKRSLYSRAMGYEHEDVDIRVIEGQVVQTPVRKYYPPDTTAAIFWLKNRDPERWRDKHETELSGSVNVTINRFSQQANEE